jgi:hypothetical protein
MTDEEGPAARRVDARTAAKADAYFSDQKKRFGEKAEGPKVAKGKRAKGGGARAEGDGSKGDGQGQEPTSEEWGPGGRRIEAAETTEREALLQLAKGEFDAFITHAKADPGFPYEPQAIGALSALMDQSPADFERLWTRLKAETSIRLQTLGPAVKMAGRSSAGPAGDSGSGRSIEYAAVEPWSEPVVGAELLAEIADAIGAYVIMDGRQRDAVALWTVYAHAHDLRDYAPLLIVVSPMKRCGKTKLQETLARLIPKPQPMTNVTAALLPRLIEIHHPTLLIDEFDALANSDKEMAEGLRGVLNSSFNRHGAVVLKLVPMPGGGWEARQFSIWSPACIAGIGLKNIPDTVRDRSLIVRLARKLTGERVKRLRGKDGGELTVLRRKIARWVDDRERALRTSEPEELGELNDRQVDAWEPLFAIAEAAGGDWPRRAHAAAAALCKADDEAAQDDDLRLVLLSATSSPRRSPRMIPLMRRSGWGGRRTAPAWRPSSCWRSCSSSRSGHGSLWERRKNP